MTYIIVQFLEEDDQPTPRPSLEKQPMRGMQQDLTNRLYFYKKITEACLLDEARHVAMKGL